MCIGRCFLGVRYLYDVLLVKMNPQKLRSADRYTVRYGFSLDSLC